MPHSTWNGSPTEYRYSGTNALRKQEWPPKCTKSRCWGLHWEVRSTCSNLILPNFSDLEQKPLLWLRHSRYLVSHIPSASNLFSASASSPISFVPGMFWHSDTLQLDFVQPRNAWQSLILAFIFSPYSLWLSCVKSYCLENKSTEQNIYDT